MRYISLFSGIGGLDRAIDSLGGECVVQVEREPYCLDVLHRRWSDVPKRRDVTRFHVPVTQLRSPLGRTWPLVDLVVGGPPCQPVSHAGRRKGAADERWLWGEALRVVSEAQPARVFFENPMGLRTLGLDAVLAGLTELGYGGAWEVVAAADVGAPHLRKRIFIMGIRGRSGWEGPTRPPGNRKVLWPSPNASGERPNEGNVRLLRQRVLDGTLTEAEAEGMLNGKSPFEAQGKVPAFPSPTTADGGGGPGTTPKREGGINLRTYVDRWPTPTSRDWKDSGDSIGSGTVPVNALLGRAVSPSKEHGSLNPTWEEWLMALPEGWTDVTRSEVGPVHSWDAEPNIPRIGLNIPNRPARVKAIGNAVCPPQAVFAWQRLSERLEQREV